MACLGPRICFQDGSLTWLMAGGLSFSAHGHLHHSLSVFPSWQLAFSRASDQEKKRVRKATMSCTSLRSEVVFWWSHSPTRMQCWRGPHKGKNTRGRDHWKPSWKLAVTGTLPSTSQLCHLPSYTLLSGFWGPGSGSQFEVSFVEIWWWILGLCWSDRLRTMGRTFQRN